MRAATALALLLASACSSKSAPALSADDRESAMGAAKQCTDTVDSLAPSYQMIGPKLAVALKMNPEEARRLIRDSVELLISTRELLCNISIVTVKGVLDKSPGDAQIAPAYARVQAALVRLGKVRTAYDQLLGAATSAAPHEYVDEAALLERLTEALVGH